MKQQGMALASSALLACGGTLMMSAYAQMWSYREWILWGEKRVHAQRFRVRLM